MEPATDDDLRPVLPGERWTPPTNLAARLFFTLLRRIHDQQDWVWRGDEPHVSLVFLTAIPQVLNVATLLEFFIPRENAIRLVGPELSSAIGVCAVSLPVLLEVWWLREPGRLHVVIWEADTYRYLSGPIGTALVVAYVVGSFLLFGLVATPAT